MSDLAMTFQEAVAAKGQPPTETYFLEPDIVRGTEAPMYPDVQNSTSPTRDESLARIEIGIQSLIFVLAVIGNSLVLLALRYRKRKTSRMHLFIMHLSIADLLVAVFNILPQLAWDVTFRFVGSDGLCRFIKYMQVMVIYLSTYILVMTAIDRYRAICKPLSNYNWTTKKVHVMVAIAWAGAIVLSIPQVIIFRRQKIPGTGEYDCWAHFQPEWTMKLYITTFSFTVYVLPFACLTILYGKICFAVWGNVRKARNSHCNGVTRAHNGKITYKFNGTGHISVIPEQSSQNSERCQQHNRTCFAFPRRHSERGYSQSKLKTIKLTFVVIIAYLVCWSPFMITQMWWAYDPTAPYNNATFVICLLLASLNSCCNPWIYMAFSGNLLQHLIPCCKKRRQPVVHLDRHHRHHPHRSKSGSDPLNTDEDQKRIPEHVPMDHVASMRRAQQHSRTSTTKLTWGMRFDSQKSRLGQMGSFGRRQENGFSAQDLETKTCDCKKCSRSMGLRSNSNVVTRLVHTD